MESRSSNTRHSARLALKARCEGGGGGGRASAACWQVAMDGCRCSRLSGNHPAQGGGARLHAGDAGGGEGGAAPSTRTCCARSHPGTCPPQTSRAQPRRRTSAPAGGSSGQQGARVYVCLVGGGLVRRRRCPLPRRTAPLQHTRTRRTHVCGKHTTHTHPAPQAHRDCQVMDDGHHGVRQGRLLAGHAGASLVKLVKRQPELRTRLLAERHPAPARTVREGGVNGGRQGAFVCSCARGRRPLDPCGCVTWTRQPEP